MEGENELGEAFINFVKGMVRGHVVAEGVIDSVDESAFTVNIKVQDSIFREVPLKVVQGSRGSLIEIPEVGSQVIFTFRDGNIQRPQLIWADKIKDFLINCSGHVIFNDGNLGGMVKVIDLTAKLNALENKVNEIISKYDSHTHPGVQSGPSSTGAPSVPVTGSITPTQRGDIENQKIKQ